MNKHKKHRPGSSGGWNFQPLGRETRIKNPDQLLSKLFSNLIATFCEGNGLAELDCNNDLVRDK